jgi:hypothetical protein
MSACARPATYGVVPPRCAKTPWVASQLPLEIVWHQTADSLCKASTGRGRMWKHAYMGSFVSGCLTSFWLPFRVKLQHLECGDVGLHELCKLCCRLLFAFWASYPCAYCLHRLSENQDWSWTLLGQTTPWFASGAVQCCLVWPDHWSAGPRSVDVRPFALLCAPIRRIVRSAHSSQWPGAAYPIIESHCRWCQLCTLLPAALCRAQHGLQVCPRCLIGLAAGNKCHMISVCLDLEEVVQ